MKILFLPYETYTREIDCLLKLTNNILFNCKYDFVIVCNSFLLKKFLLYFPFPKSVIQLKSAQISIIKYLNKLNKKKFQITVHNAEALCTFDTEDRYDPFVHPMECLKYIQNIFVCNAIEFERVNNYCYNIPHLKISKTGFLRCINYSDNMDNIYEKEIRSINRITRNKKFVLYNSTAGIKYHFFSKYDREASRKQLLGLGILSDHVDDLLHWSDHSQITFFSFLEFIRLFNNQYSNDYCIVFRPHPSEDYKLFENVLSGIDNVVICNEYSVIPWIKSAEIIIGSTSTSLIESALMKKPTISFLPDYNNEVYNLLLKNDSAYVCPVSKSPQELFLNVQNYINGNPLEKRYFDYALSLTGEPSQVTKNFTDAYLKIGKDFIPSSKFKKLLIKIYIINLFNLLECVFKFLSFLNFEKISYVFTKSKFINNDKKLIYCQNLKSHASIFKNCMLFYR